MSRPISEEVVSLTGFMDSTISEWPRARGVPIGKPLKGPDEHVSSPTHPPPPPSGSGTPVGDVKAAAPPASAAAAAAAAAGDAKDAAPAAAALPPASPGLTPVEQALAHTYAPNPSLRPSKVSEIKDRSVCRLSTVQLQSLMLMLMMMLSLVPVLSASSPLSHRLPQPPANAQTG
jgi:hypothetical protein